MSGIEVKVLVVGGGPGGYVAALRAARLGLDTALVEGDRLGGACLIRGCIPSKALIHAADLFQEMRAASEGPRFGIRLRSKPELDLAGTMDWKESIVERLNAGVGALLRRAGVRVIEGWARFSDAKTCAVDIADGEVRITAEHVIVATGSQPAEIPSIPFGGAVLSSSEALSLRELPARLAVIGAGYIGLELGTAFAKLGARVTVVEAQPDILPQYDTALTTPVRRWLEVHQVTLHLGARAVGFAGGQLAIQTAAGERLDLPADRVLVTVGRRPNLRGLEAMGLEMEGAFIKVDRRCATATRNVWAIGDVVGEPMLAHKASAQGEMVAEIIAGHRRQFDPRAIPAVCFTEPEIVSAGVSAPAGEVVVGQFPLLANGRALTMDAGLGGGFVRVIACKGDQRILGVQAVGRQVSELSAQFAALIEMGATLEDVAGIVHAHPTQSEAVHEAALKALGHAIHI